MDPTQLQAKLDEFKAEILRRAGTDTDDLGWDDDELRGELDDDDDVMELVDHYMSKYDLDDVSKGAFGV